MWMVWDWVCVWRRGRLVAASPCRVAAGRWKAEMVRVLLALRMCVEARKEGRKMMRVGPT